jgi:hypothetical protein
MNRFLPAAAWLATLCVSANAFADPLHPIANDAYWHHESNFIFPATLGTFARVGVPQELDGSTTVTAYYAQGNGDARVVVQIWVFPAGVGVPDDARFSVERGGWHVAVRAPLFKEDSRLEELIHAFPLERLGKVDTRCPNPGCGD